MPPQRNDRRRENVFFFSLKLKKTNTKQTCVKFKLQNICTHLMKCNDDNLRTFYEIWPVK